MIGEFPSEDMALTVLLVVSDLDRSVAFYRDVLGASLYREYGGTSAVFSFAGTWILLVTGGEPTKDKPDVTFTPPADCSVARSILTAPFDGAATVFAPFDLRWSNVPGATQYKVWLAAGPEAPKVIGTRSKIDI